MTQVFLLDGDIELSNMIWVVFEEIDLVELMYK